MIDASSLQLKYEGSVKKVFDSKVAPDTLWFYFTNQYSVFDWGQMPDMIANKGNALAIIGTYIFQELANPKLWKQLSESKHLQKFDSQYLKNRFDHSIFRSNDGLRNKGLLTHFLGLDLGTPIQGGWDEWEKLESLFSLKKDQSSQNYLTTVDPKNKLLMKVLKAQVNWPRLDKVENRYIYPAPDPNFKSRLIPLEVVFRFGMVEGSSLKHKLEKNPEYVNILGLKSLPKINEWFPQPVLEFFTKLEPKDRLLTTDEAIDIAKLSQPQFEYLTEISKDIALALHVMFAEQGLELWDGKLEFIFDSELGKLLLADSVGPDELRLLYKGVQLSKELLRQYYRPSAWYKSLASAQKIAAENGIEEWQGICRKDLKQSPEPLAPDVKNIVDKLYGVLTNKLTAHTVFPNHPSLDELIASINKTFSQHNKEQVNA